jgi:RNA polymerase sigma-70 factor (ECF subfamily)
VRSDLDQVYRDLRPYAFAIAYRMLGSVSEAEDVAQDAFLRLAQAGDGHIGSHKAYVATVTTRLAIDELRSARARRESYLGPWLPEPLLDDGTQDVATAAETADSLTMAFLVILETLTPLERAAFLLHDVFGYDYREIAAIVDKSEANCRQLASRARRRVHDDKPRFEASREQRDQLAARFFAACQGREMDGLVELLAADAAFYGDGGTKGTGVNRPIYGRDNIVKLLDTWFRQGERLGIEAELVTINGQPGAKFLDPQGRLINVISLDIADGTVQTIRSIVNPDKLTHLGPLSPIGRRSNTGEWAADTPVEHRDH